ncbi:MAG: SpoIIAA family protein [Methanotrichaceae archaeon]
MFEKLDGSSGKVIGFRASGRLKDADYKEIAPQFEKAIEESGKIRVLWEMGDDFRGWDAKATWDDFKYWREWKDDIERMVLVGDKKMGRVAVEARQTFHEVGDQVLRPFPDRRGMGLAARGGLKARIDAFSAE